MNQLHNFTLIILLVVIIHIEAEGQESEKHKTRLFRPNSLSGSIGFAGVVATSTLNIERMVTQWPEKKITATFIKAGYGVYASWGEEGKYGYVQYGFITGQRTSHMEVGIGPNFAIKGDMEIPVAGFIGYRFQKPSRHFILRTGLALPETLYLGLGIAL